jgi:hypothetical protein
MIHEINKTEFIDAFRIWHGGDYKNNFSYDGLDALFDYLDEIEEYELDIVGICCNYSEYENLAEIKQSYPDIETIEDLREFTEVIEIPNTERLIIAGY